MLCHLIRVWKAYAFMTGLFPSSGKMYVTPSHEPVAMVMSYQHREIAIVNHREYLPCFTADAIAHQIPVVRLSPDLSKYTTVNQNQSAIDHYVLFDESAEIRLPKKAERADMSMMIRSIVRKNRKTNQSDATRIRSIIRSILEIDTEQHPASALLPSTSHTIRELVRSIVRLEHPLSRSISRIRRKGSKTGVKRGSKIAKGAKKGAKRFRKLIGSGRMSIRLERKIKALVELMVRSSRNRAQTAHTIRKMFSVARHTAKPAVRRARVRAMIQKVIRTNAHYAFTPKKVDKMMKIIRNPRLSKRAVRVLVKRVINSIIYTHTNQAMTRHKIDAMIKSVRSISRPRKGKKIAKKGKKIAKKGKKIAKKAISKVSEGAKAVVKKVAKGAKAVVKKVSEGAKAVVKKVKKVAKKLAKKGKKSKRVSKKQLKAIRKSILKRVNTIIDTTVKTIVPSDAVRKIIKIMYRTPAQQSIRGIKKSRNLIRSIRVEDDVILEESCTCKTKKGKRVVKKAVKAVKAVKAKRVKMMQVKKSKQVVISVAEKVKSVQRSVKEVAKDIRDVVKDMSDLNKQVKQIARVIPAIAAPSSRRLPLPSPSPSQAVAKPTKAVVKKAKKLGKKGKKSKTVRRLLKKAAAITKTIKGLKRVTSALKKRRAKVINVLKTTNDRAVFDAALERLHAVNRKRLKVATTIAKLAVSRFKVKQAAFRASPAGKKAITECKKMGARGQVLQGCLQDMRLAPQKTAMIKKAVASTVKAVVAAKKANRIQRKTGNAPSRTCTANGDPHFTNFNGDYFHLQVESIYTFAKTSDGLFEVQVKQGGSSGPGSPSYVRDVMIRYDGVVYRNNFAKDGFSVSSGNSWVSVTVPGAYQGEMMGICGANGVSRAASNFILPSGAKADVAYGSSNWEFGGYGGANTKLSRWHLAWRPLVEDCMFSKADCQKNARPMGVASKPVWVRTPWGRVNMAALS